MPQKASSQQPPAKEVQPGRGGGIVGRGATPVVVLALAIALVVVYKFASPYISSFALT